MPQTIIITGAGSGIGKAVAECFLENGWNVALVGRRESHLQDVAKNRPQALAIPCDITDPAAVARGFAQAIAHFSHLDVLFNNAGVFVSGGTIDEISLADWQSSLDVNLTGSFLCAREAFKIMRQQHPQGGRIINNGSISAYSPRAKAASYTVSKHAITGLTKSISLDGRAFDIACGQIDIGNARTEMVSALIKSAEKAGEKAEETMDVIHIAQSVFHMANLPLQANVQFMTVMATKMPYIGRG